MKNTRGFLLATSLVFAMLFTLSCSIDELGGDSSSSSGGGQGGGGGGYTGSYGSIEYGGQTYKTVRIGTQTWMAENLNYDPGTGNSACYDNQASNCATYGRLYDWSTAMGFESSCNSNSCSSQIQSKHRGICPSGWHLPSDSEWNVLEGFAGSTSYTDIGTKLKATSGWNDYNGASGNGTDQYGFSALPGGLGTSGVGFYNVGSNGGWWNATEDGSYNAYRRDMSVSNSYVTRGGLGKSYLCSIRCVQD